ncbi:MAG: DPP IV N-terminal domain-containing protein [Anaerolineae bacterium]|nr:DPP IV N-terminal domain-containing protein [Anaerolineae bacterium]
MLVRAYRLTDRMGVVILKSSAALTDGLLGSASAVRRFIVGVLLLIWSVVRWLLLLVWSVIRALLAVIGAVALFALNMGRRMTGQAVRYAGDSTETVMARRAARAELEASLTEDPLKAQNRVLSGVIVVLLAVLIGVVLWATNPTAESPLVLAPNQFNSDAADAAVTPQATNAGVAVALIPTSVPTATAVPAILEARGSLAYVVRENAQDDIWAVDVGEQTPLRLISSEADDRDPAWSPDGRRLAYASHQDGNWEIYIYDVQTDNTTRMTYDLSFQGAPQWSPDGQWLVYESYQGDNLDVYLMRVDGSQVERLTSHPEPDFEPAWSPDGRQIAFVSWRDGNQDIYVISLDDPRDEAAINVTNSPTRYEDYPAWSPDGRMLAYSALDEGIEKVFVKTVSEANAPARVIGRGRTPTWSPDGASLIVAVDSFDGTQLIAVPFAEQGVATLVVPVAQGATNPNWAPAPLPAAVTNGGGVPLAGPGRLYIEQEQRADEDPPYKLQSLINIDTQIAALSDRVNDSFNALREEVNDAAGYDFLGELEDAFWPIDRLPQPGEERRNWHMTGRAFAINRNNIAGFPPPIEIVREDLDIQTYWRVFVRVAEDAQDGQLGEPLRRIPWDFISRNQGDVEAYNQGGRVRSTMPTGYYVDLTRLAADFGWQRLPAGNDWRANFNSTNYWIFYKSGGLAWYDAMRELYSEGELGGFAPQPTAIPAQPLPTEEGQSSQPIQPTVAPTIEPTIEPLLPPPPTVQAEESG